MANAHEPGVPSIRRIVRTPERWPRIVELAARYGETLPAEADSRALNTFLQKRKAVDEVHYADLSLAVIKLMGRASTSSRGRRRGSGALRAAAHDYTHSTAPNRRFADTVTQRLIKSVLAKRPSPYSTSNWTPSRGTAPQGGCGPQMERTMGKRIAAVALQHRIGETFAPW